MPKNRSYKWRCTNGTVEISVSTTLYSQEPLFATCCVFMDDFYVWLDFKPNKKNYKISLIPKNNSKKFKNTALIVGEFQNELLNNVLRYKIASRNQKVREAIVKEALFFSQPKREQMKTLRELSIKEKVPRKISIKLHKDIYSAAVIKKAIQDFSGIASITVTDSKNYHLVNIPNISKKSEIELVKGEFLNYCLILAKAVI